MRELRVGLAGLGHVGSEVARLLRTQGARLSRLAGVRLTLAAALDRRAEAKLRRLGLFGKVRVVRDPRALAADPSLGAVVELLGGRDAARGLVLESLRRGKAVVTANKALLAHHWEELFGAARASGGRLGFEAAVAGGIPVLRALSESLASDRVLAVEGILNGTANYVLCELAKGRSMAEAVREAQRLGLAERDPRLDLDGTDAAHKLSVLASLVTGRWLPSSRIPREGIEGLGPEDARFAAEELGRTPRLVALCRFEPFFEARVGPALVELEHPLAAVHGAFNAVTVEAASAGELTFLGRGAGPGPAASAVLGDLLALARGGRGQLPPASPAKPKRPAEPPKRAYYLRFLAADRPGVLGRIATELGRARVSIDRVLQRSGGPGPVPVALVTHPAEERRVRAAAARIAGRGGVRPGEVVLPLL